MEYERTRRTKLWLAATALAGALVASVPLAGATYPGGSGDHDGGRGRSDAGDEDHGRGSWYDCSAGELYALTPEGKLLSVNRWDPSSPSCILQVGNYLGYPVGLDTRPADGLLYMVTNDEGVGRIYTVEPSTGWATFVSQIAVPLRGESFGVDFNPVPDRLRMVSDSGQNLRINVDTGATTGTPAGSPEDGPLAYAATDANAGQTPAVMGAAYTNSVAPSPRTEPGTTLYDIDAALDVLVTQAPPNDGTLNTRGSLGVDVEGMSGFDIDGSAANEAVAVLQVAGEWGTRLYDIDLDTGQATDLGYLGWSGPVVGLTFNGSA